MQTVPPVFFRGDHIALSPYCLLLLLTAAWAFTSCAGKFVDSEARTTPIIIDGQTADWEAYNMIFEQGISASWQVINDNEMLYVSLRTTDGQLVHHLNRRGGVIWINGKGKKKKTLGIRYADENARLLHMARIRERFSNRNRDRTPAIENQARAVLSGKFYLIDGDTTALPAGGRDGLQATARSVDGIYFFELRLPLAKAGITPGKRFKLGLEISAIDPQVREQMKEAMDDRRRGGAGISTGGAPGGGMPGGGRRGTGMAGGLSGSDPNSILKQLDGQQAWITVKTSQSPQ